MSKISHTFVEQISWRGEVYHGYCPSVPDDLALALGLGDSSDSAKPLQIDPNSDSLEEFAKIPNVSPKLAEAIISLKGGLADSKYKSFEQLKELVSPYVFFSETDWAALGSHFSFETPAPIFAPPIPDPQIKTVAPVTENEFESAAEDEGEESEGEESEQKADSTQTGSHRRRPPKTS